MSDQIRSGASTGPDPADDARPGDSSAPTQRVVTSSELPTFSVQAPILVGILAWTALFALALFRRTELESHGHGWWIWTALIGIVLGAIGLALTNRRFPRR